MTGFEPRTSGIGSDRSANCATQPLPFSSRVLHSHWINLSPLISFYTIFQKADIYVGVRNIRFGYFGCKYQILDSLFKFIAAVEINDYYSFVKRKQ